MPDDRPEACAYRFRRKPHAEWKSRWPRAVISVFRTGIETHTHTPRDQLYYVISYIPIYDKYNPALRCVHNTCNSRTKVKTHHVGV